MTTNELEQLLNEQQCCWNIFTCDEGYCCQLYEVPERGHRWLGHGTGWSVEDAVMAALKNKDMGPDQPEHLHEQTIT